MAMTVDTDGKFLLQETSSTKEYTKELNTAGKYVDRNIKIDITAKDGALGADVSVSGGSASMTATGFTADTGTTDTGYSVSLATTSGKATGKAKVTTAGWIGTSATASTGATNVPVSGNGTVIKIPKATLTGSTSDLTAPKVTVGISSSGIATIEKPTTGTEGTDFFSVTATGTGTNGSVKAKATVNKTGMVGASDAVTSSAIAITPSITGSDSKLYIPKATTSVTNGTATATAGTATTSVTGMKTSTTNTGYSVTASATGGNASVTASSAVVSAGYAPSKTTASTSVKSATGENKSSTTYIQKGVLGATVSGNITFTPSVSSTMVTSTATPTGTDGTDFYSITGSGTKSGTVTGKASVSIEGYVKSETATGGSASGTIGDAKKLYVAKTKYTNTLPTGMTENQFTDISSSAPILASGGYLYISAGYNPNQKISLARLVPDDVTSIVGSTSDKIVSGETAFNKDGGIITGSLAQLSLSATLQANADATTYPAGYDYYIVSASNGHNRTGSAQPEKIPVYQGDWVV
mgnify:FL=1